MVSKIFEWFQSQSFEKCTKFYEQSGSEISVIEKYFIAISYLFLEKYIESQQLLTEIKSQRSKLPDYHTYVALNYLKLGDVKKSKYYLDQEVNNSQLLYFETNIEVTLKLGQLVRLKRLLDQSEKNGCRSINIEINKAIYFKLKHNYLEAEQILLKLFSKDPDNDIIIDNLVKIYIASRQSEKSIQLLVQVIKRKPKELKYLWKLALEYSFEGKHKQLEEMMKKVEAVDPALINIRRILTIPSVYDGCDQQNRYREMIETHLDIIESKNLFPNEPNRSVAATPFFLAYHNASNKNILVRIANIMAKGCLQVPKLTRKTFRKKPKIGLISQHFYSHSVMDFYENTLANFPKSMHITMINISPFKIDATTKKIMARADEYYQLSTKHEEIIPFVLSCDFDMIIYPEVGMAPCIYYLAMLRLAPIQTLIIGHPETSGIATIDYFVSWKHFHQKNPVNEFSESVIQLDQFPLCYEVPKEVTNIKKYDLKIPNQSKLFFVPMMAFKLHPVFDQVIEAIIKNDPSNFVMIVRYNNMEQVVVERLKKRLSNGERSQLIVSNRLTKSEYFSVLDQANVILETFPFGGGNTMLQSLAIGTPYISLDSDFLRGSFGTGFYRYINEHRFIAKTIDEYIQLAIQTAYDPSIKAEFKKMVAKNHNKLFNNMSGSKEFYQWIHSILNN